MSNQTHKALLAEIDRLHEKKAADYAHGGDPYSNFKRAAQVAGMFSDPVDQVFASLIGVKLARIAELSEPRRTVNNESLDDSFVDLTNYCAIWTSYHRDQRAAKTPNGTYSAAWMCSRCGAPNLRSNGLLCLQCGEKAVGLS